MQISGLNSLVLAVEWVDLDSRLGIRNLGGWKPTTFSWTLLASVIRVAAMHWRRSWVRFRSASPDSDFHAYLAIAADRFTTGRGANQYLPLRSELLLDTVSSS